MTRRLAAALFTALLPANAAGGEDSSRYWVSTDGIYRLGTAPGGGPALLSETPDGERVFLAFADLPKEQLGRGNTAEELYCVAAPRKACLMRVKTSAGQRLALLNQRDTAWRATYLRYDQLPPTFTFKRFAISVGSSGRTYVAIPPTPTSSGSVVQWSMDAPETQQVMRMPAGAGAYLRPVFDSSAVSGFALVEKLPTQMQADDLQPGEWWIFRGDGRVDKVAPVQGCRPQAVFRDTIVCVLAQSVPSPNQPFGVAKASAGGYAVAAVSATLTGAQVNANFFEGQPFHRFADGLLFDGFVEGIRRPYFLDWPSMSVRPLFASRCESGLGKDVHVSAVGATEGAKGVLAWVFGPLNPSRFSLLGRGDIEAGRCPGEGRSGIRAEPAFDASGYSIVRSATKRRAPYTLIRSTAAGEASGKLLVRVYGVDGIWLQEGYQRLWRLSWLAKGGSIAFVHVRGGGGYGERWWLAGRGVAGKQAAVADLIGFAEEMRRRPEVAGKGIAVYGESGGGIVAGIAALRRPDLFPAVVLRAACFGFEAGVRRGCAMRDDFGNIDDPKEAKAMLDLSPRHVAAKARRLPSFLFLIPQSDERVPRSEMIASAMALPPANRTISDLPGVDHTDALPEEKERALTQDIVRFVLEKTRR